MAKERPVLILQDDVENRNPHYPFVIVVPLTSRKVDAIYAEDVLLPKGIANWPVTSKALLGLIFAVSKETLQVRRVRRLRRAFGLRQVDTATLYRGAGDRHLRDHRH